MSVEEKVKTIIGNQIKKNPAEIQNGDDFASLGADSLDTVELVMAFEDEFNCSIPDEEAAKLKTVQDAVDFLTKNGK